MPSLSAVIITYNEEKNIGRCIESLLGIADEIVVVDSYSADRTKEICERYPVRFIHHSFENYIVQKNYANNLAECDYILSIDADEELSEELIQSLRTWKALSDVADAYTINRRNNYCGRWIRYSGWYPDRKIRLWKKSRGKWGGPIPHEIVLMEEDSRVSHLHGDLLHRSYTNIEEHRVRTEQYARMAALSMHRNGIPYNYFRTVYKPAARFIKHYIVKLGFLDGREGFRIARMMAREVRLKYRLLKDLELK